MPHGHFHAGHQPLHFCGDIVRMARRDPEHHDAALQIEALRDPPDDHQTKEHQGRCIPGNHVKAAPHGHPNGRFHKHCCRCRHSHYAAGLPQNRPSPQKADALHDVGCDSGAPRIAKSVRDFAGKNGEKRSRQANEEARANPCRPPPQVAFNADDRAQRRRNCQSQKNFVERKHRFADSIYCPKSILLFTI